MDREREALLAVISHLQKRSSLENERGHLDVAVCELRQAFAIDDEELGSFSGSSFAFPAVYAAGCKSLAGSSSVSESRDEAKRSSESTDLRPSAVSSKDGNDNSFAKLLSKLHSTTSYFEGCERGSSEYSKRVAKAKAKFDLKLAEKRSSSLSGDSRGHESSFATHRVEVDAVPCAESSPCDSASDSRVQQGTEVSSDCVAQAESLKEVGNMHIKKKDYKEAYNAYTNAIECDPTNAVLYSNRAAALLQMSKFDDAIKDCEKAIEIDPQFIRARERLASAYRNLRMFDAEYATLAQASAMNPGNERLRAETASASERIATASRGEHDAASDIPTAAKSAGAAGTDAGSTDEAIRDFGTGRTPSQDEARSGGEDSSCSRNYDRPRSDESASGNSSGRTSQGQGGTQGFANIFGNLAGGAHDGQAMGLEGLMSAMNAMSGSGAMQQFMNQSGGPPAGMQEMMQGMMQNPDLMRTMMQSVGAMFAGSQGNGSTQPGNSNGGSR